MESVHAEPVQQGVALAQVWFDDVVPGASLRAGPHRVTREDIIEFALRWDPFPFHTDEVAAAATPLGGLFASGIHTLAIKQLLVHRLPILESAVASLGYDELRFTKAVRPGAELTLVWTWGERRESRSQPDRGIVKAAVRLEQADGVPVLTYTDTVMMLKRVA